MALNLIVARGLADLRLGRSVSGDIILLMSFGIVVLKLS
jgi:hypothetical protein